MSQQLLLNMKSQTEICTQYRDIQKKKKEVIILGDINALDQLVKEEQTLLMKMESLDKKRIAIMKKENLEGYSLAEVAENYIDPEYSEAFARTYDQLTSIVNEMKKLIFINQRLLKQRLSVVETVLKAIESDPGLKKAVKNKGGKPFINFIKRA